MNEKALKSLEYYKIIQLLTEKASSPLGKELCRDLLPSVDLAQIQLMQAQDTGCTVPSFPERKHLFWKCKRCAWFTETPGDRQYTWDH